MFARYGGRGITVCDRWRHSFENFLADMGMKPSPRHSLDRKENDGNYEPSNCRWALPRDQCNNRNNNTNIEFRGITRTVTEWARELGMHDTTLFMRLYKSKWTVERALTTPVRSEP
jgi:hypothetical protein